MELSTTLRFIKLSITLSCLLCCVVRSGAQTPRITNFDKQRGQDMLSIVKSDIKKNYYDPSFHGVDLDTRFKTADEKIKTATSNGQIFGIIAQAMLDLDDSHTFFLPPGRSARTQYGFEMQIIGDNCFVTAVQPGSDAEAKGLKVGDQILGITGTQPTREEFWRIQYYFNALRPQAGMKLTIRRPDGKESELIAMAKVTPLKRVVDLTSSVGIYDLIREQENDARFNRHRFYEGGESGNDFMIWKMPGFDFEESQVDDLMSKVRKSKALILDLRGNPGGYVVTLQRLVGYFFDHDLKIADLKGRKEMKPQTAKTRGDKIFKGQVVVLIDSRSGSAAEIFARLMQLEKRGTVIGDRSSGAVMQSQQFSHESGMDTIAFWGVSVTNADVIMSDGKSIEKIGVLPDELLLPAAADMAAHRDPVLARAVSLVGGKLDAERAGALFPIEWRK